MVEVVEMRGNSKRDVRFSLPAPVPPEKVTAALTDFTDRRPELWPDLDPDAYQIHQLGPTSALVREGQTSPRLWALEEYDWSTPGTVTWTARESNFCTPGSYMSARAEPDGAGRSLVRFAWNRTGVGVKGKLIVSLMRLTGGRPLAANLAKALARLGEVTDASRADPGQDDPPNQDPPNQDPPNQDPPG
jgi:hypothetical protein